MRILYLGLDPSRYPRNVTHYPVIRTVPIETLDETTRRILPSVTHTLFTSRSAVKHWLFLSSVQGEALALGPATAAALQERGLKPIVAPISTQEGVIALLETMNLSGAFFFWPKSSSARPLLQEYLVRRKISFHGLDLYETKWHRPEPMPNLDEFDEIVFTSPTTVDAFLKIFGAIPKLKKLTPIGPITEAALKRF